MSEKCAALAKEHIQGVPKHVCKQNEIATAWPTEELESSGFFRIKENCSTFCLMYFLLTKCEVMNSCIQNQCFT